MGNIISYGMFYFPYLLVELNNGGVPMKKIDYYELGKRIRRCREELGLSQEAAAEQCGISPSFYSNIERGIKIMSLETFCSICSTFSVSADYLLSDELPQTDERILNILSEVKKSGNTQYEKYLKTISALAHVADHL